MLEIKPIRSEEDYKAALAEIDKLLDAEDGTPEADALEVISILVEVYEEENYPVGLPDPIEAIKFHMERLGLTRKDLQPFIGSRGRVSEILNRQRPLTLEMIRRLQEGLDISPEILTQKYGLSEPHLQRYPDNREKASTQAHPAMRDQAVKKYE